MNAYLNFLIEANMGLCLFLILHFVLMKNETDFRFRRILLLSGILVSILFPLFHLNMQTHVPVLGDVIPPTWLPEVTVTADGDTQAAKAATGNVSFWTIINIVYVAGAAVVLLLFIVRLKGLFRVFGAAIQTPDRLIIIETDELTSSFSFFRYIVIGQASQLSDQEKHQIIEHEKEHARRFHSADIVLLQILKVVFWFNPLIKIYEKIFVQLHEFEADARAVENHDKNDYCSLMAKVALLSADIKLANHFSNSLTLKRIEMIRKHKTQIKYWKHSIMLVAFAGFFFLVACQDQVMNEVTEIAKNSTMTLHYPKVVQDKLDELKAKNPEHKYIVVVPDDKDGLRAEAIQDKLKDIDPSYISSMDVMKDILDQNGVKRSYIVIDYNEEAKLIANNAKTEDQVFMIVEESATMPGGIEAIGGFIAQNLRYPQDARRQGIEGTVFVSFIVNADGSLTDFNVVKGLSPSVDAEAIRVAGQFPKWTPGRQNGKAVRQRFVLPISFKLQNSAPDSK
jgi:TonB family protein